MVHKFHPSILRAYDIRGIYNKTLFDKDAHFLGKSFAKFLFEQGLSKVSLAYDGRASSITLKNNLINGLIESGIKVIEVGLGPTPMLYFSIYHLSVDAGIMITGSHNPPEHNGFKIMLKDRPFFGDDILNLAKIAENGDFVFGNGSLSKQIIVDNYVARIASDSVFDSESGIVDELDDFFEDEGKQLRIAWDSGNGVGGEVMKKLAVKIKSKDFLLYDEIDGSFPNHHPDPSDEKNLVDLRKAVLENNCHLGIAFDGDGDRIGIIDDEGEILWGDQLMVLYARDLLLNHPGATIIADVKASDVLFSEIAKAGGKPLMWKTGHSLIKAKMKETKALLAGEMSGHIFFADKYYGYDDAFYAAVRIINIIQISNRKLSDLRKSIPQTFSTPEFRIDCPDDKKFQIIETLKNQLVNDGISFDDVDGVRIRNADGWWLLRASNTQAVLVARCEGRSAKSLENLKKDLDMRMAKYNLKLPD